MTKLNDDAAMGFVGVSTGESSIRKVFPAWARVLGLPSDQLVGFDLPVGASREQYREVVGAIQGDPGLRGALITTHKIGVHDAAGDMFAELDEFAGLCGEISSVSKRGDALVGHAKDPITAGLSIEEFLAPDHFARTGADLLCLGAGGAGTAIAWYLARRDDRPRRIVCTDTDEHRLAELVEVLRRGGLDTDDVVAVVADGPADELVAACPEGSLIVNATGLGKDRPGSPLSDEVRWPRNAVVWELNYRGSLEFLHQARAQEESAQLTVVDGWRYFIHGWSQVIAEVFDLELDEQTVGELAAAAEAVR
ncbi:saccharopine dehydrogenase NADP-binding domain-containing protein [Saccharopolyspora sp. WRP15-2]|uniref:Saccharopine dehydrogenase NADP-binding domain-containing protein n=1 Tax=Saccharopolyspora oryzae TaxID=2997343 RepID=A0ABT4V596_9PSEU|nr:saccharopine dehydrogenase NADP-binding domain-containing protein [Saccharopolyspora oryzae]MDA3629013.1 saccharopine dehydrogenase NADP-binding domain-containing protein [Saccharopolyspora oryzae]